MIFLKAMELLLYTENGGKGNVYLNTNTFEH